MGRVGSGRGDGRQRGFTLVEVLVALLILGFIALGIATLFSHSMMVNASGYDYAVLASEARQAMERLRSLPFDDAALAATGGTPRTIDAMSGRITIRYTVEDYDLFDWGDVAGPTWAAVGGGGFANAKRITMTVMSAKSALPGRRQFVTSAVRISPPPPELGG